MGAELRGSSVWTVAAGGERSKSMSTQLSRRWIEIVERK